jgi:hypothetical protein
VAGAEHLGHRRERAQSSRRLAEPRLQYERRFRQVELARDGLHPLGVEAVGAEHDRQRIPCERQVSEHIDQYERIRLHARVTRSPRSTSSQAAARPRL